MGKKKSTSIAASVSRAPAGPWARPSPECNIFVKSQAPQGWSHYNAHFTDHETEAQRSSYPHPSVTKKKQDLNPGLFTRHSPTPRGSEELLECGATPPPCIPGPMEGAQSTLRPRLPSLPELREAGLRTADPLGFVLGTKESGSRLSGEWRGARSPLPPAGLAGSAPACFPTAPEPSASYSEPGLSPTGVSKARRSRGITGGCGRLEMLGGGAPMGLPTMCQALPDLG